MVQGERGRWRGGVKLRDSGDSARELGFRRKWAAEREEQRLGFVSLCGGP